MIFWGHISDLVVSLLKTLQYVPITHIIKYYYKLLITYKPLCELAPPASPFSLLLSLWVFLILSSTFCSRIWENSFQPRGFCTCCVLCLRRGTQIFTCLAPSVIRRTAQDKQLRETDWQLNLKSPTQAHILFQIPFQYQFYFPSALNHWKCLVHVFVYVPCCLSLLKVLHGKRDPDCPMSCMSLQHLE